MKFTVLKVGIGDSFLLEANSKKILVDTGNEQYECEKLISKKGIKELDLIIITHYDSDHVNGLVEIIKSDISIKEIWLPETFGRINETLKEEKDNLLKQIINSDFEQANTVVRLLVYDFFLQNHKHIFIKILSDKSTESGKIIAETHYLNEVYEKIIENSKDQTIGIIQQIPSVLITYINKSHVNKIKDIVEECKKKGIKIKWLKYTDELENEEINKKINIIGVNCKEKENIKAYYDDLETIFYLTRINRESLVFKYQEKDSLPNILFSADSGFEFLGENEKINLTNNSIVTASHHGSKERLNVGTYNLVSGKDLIYVRSDNKNNKRPCCEYIKLEKKYCTICNTMNEKEEIILEYLNNEWKANKEKCKCNGNKYNPSC